MRIRYINDELKKIIFNANMDNEHEGVVATIEEDIVRVTLYIQSIFQTMSRWYVIIFAFIFYFLDLKYFKFNLLIVFSIKFILLKNIRQNLSNKIHILYNFSLKNSVNNVNIQQQQFYFVDTTNGDDCLELDQKKYFQCHIGNMCLDILTYPYLLKIFI